MDDIITKLGTGPMTYLYFFAASMSPTAEVVNLVGSQFIAPPVEFTCLDSKPTGVRTANSSECFISSVEGHPNFSEPCTKFNFSQEVHPNTLTQEFELVCSRSNLQELYQMLFTVGCMVGCLVGGVLADRFGRQPSVFYGATAVTMFTIILVSVPNLPTILCCRFFMGVATTIIVPPAFTIGLESCPLPLRATYGVCVALPYALMLSLLAGIAYVSPDWRTTQLAASFPLFILLIASNPFLLKESARWLVTQGRVQEAEAVLHHIAKWNKSTYCLPDDLKTTLKAIHAAQAAENKHEESLLKRLTALVSTTYLRKITAIVVAVWLMQSCLYISIPLGVDQFSSPYIYMAMLGFAELPAYTASAPITARLGRKKFIIGALLLTCILQIIIVGFTFCSVQIDWLNMLLLAVSYMLVCSVFQVNLTFCSELYPTTVRNMGTSLAFFMSSVGFNIPPMLDMVLPAELPWLSKVIYSTLAGLAAVLITLLPETNNKPLLQSVNGSDDTVNSKK